MVLDTHAAELTAHFFDTFADAYDDWFWGLAIEATDRSKVTVTSQAGAPEFLN